MLCAPACRGKGWDCGPTRPDPIDPHESRNVLDGFHAEVVERERAIPNLVVGLPRDVNAARLRQAFQTGRDIHPGAEHVVALANHISDVDADAQLDPLLWRLDVTK